LHPARSRLTFVRAGGRMQLRQAEVLVHSPHSAVVVALRRCRYALACGDADEVRTLVSAFAGVRLAQRARCRRCVCRRWRSVKRMAGRRMRFRSRRCCGLPARCWCVAIRALLSHLTSRP
jgi:hypothetical protein